MKKVNKIMAKLLAFIMAISVFSVSNAFAYDTSGLPETEYNFKNSTVYEAPVQLRNYKNPADKSMAGDVMSDRAIIMVDQNGEATVKLEFKPAEIMGIVAYATGFNLYQKDQEGKDDKFISGMKFTKGEDNSAICTFKLPYKSKTGIFPGKIDSNIMSNEVSLHIDWSKLKEVSNLRKYLEEKVKLAKNIDKDEYTKESYQNLDKAIKNGETALSSGTESELIEAEKRIDESIKQLSKIHLNPFKANEKVQLDVKDEDVIGRNLLFKYAFVSTNEKGVSTVTLKFNKYTDWSGDTIVRNVKFLDRDGSEISGGKFVIDKKTGDSNYTFELPYISPKGRYKAKITADNDETDKIHDIVFDWSTIRTGADFRDLKRELDEAKKLDENKFLKKGFAKLREVIEESQKVLNNKNSEQEVVDKQIEKLKKAVSELVSIDNKGTGNTVNLGFSNMTNPTVPTDDEERAWSGGRVSFGKDKNLWKILDKDSGKLMIDKALVEHKYNEEIADVHWDNSGIRKYLNGEYFENTFNQAERSVLKEELVKSMDIKTGKTEIAPATKDKVYLLSFNDFSKAEYGFKSNESRKSAYTLLTRDRGSMTNVYFLAVIFAEGMPFDNGMMVNSEGLAAAPVINIDKDKVLLTKELGKDFNGGIQTPKKTEENTWNLTLLNEKMYLSAENAVVENDEVTAEYKDNNTKDSDISIMVVRNGDFKSGELIGYGKVLNKAGEKGKVKFTLPKGFDKKTDKVYMFSEISNPEYGSDVASKPVVLDIKEKKKDEKDNKDEDKGNKPSTDKQNDKKEKDTGKISDNKKDESKDNSSVHDKKKAPKTGDEMQLDIVIAFMIFAVMAFSVNSYRLKKSYENKKKR